MISWQNLSSAVIWKHYVVCTRFLASFSSSRKGDFKFFCFSRCSRPCKAQQLKCIYMSWRVKMKKRRERGEVLQLSLELSPENRNTTLTSFALFHIMLHMFTLACYSFVTLCLRANLASFCTNSNILSFVAFVLNVNLISKNWTALSVLASLV